MRRANVGVAIAALLIFAGYVVFVLVVSLSSGDGQGSGYWASIALLVLLVLASVWAAVYLFRHRFSKR
jgi:hypothetical protein